MDGLGWVEDGRGPALNYFQQSVLLQTIIKERAIDDKVTVDIAASAR